MIGVDFQDMFVTLFWPALEMMLAAYVASTVVGVVVHILTHSFSYRRRRSDTAFGQNFSE